MSNQKTNKEVSKQADVQGINDLIAIEEFNKHDERRLTKDELVEKVKAIFTLDEISVWKNTISINSTYKDHLFTHNELIQLFELSIKHNFKISFLEKGEYREYTHIGLNLEDSFIIL